MQTKAVSQKTNNSTHNNENYRNVKQNSISFSVNSWMFHLYYFRFCFSKLTNQNLSGSWIINMRVVHIRGRNGRQNFGRWPSKTILLPFGYNKLSSLRQLNFKLNFHWLLCWNEFKCSKHLDWKVIMPDIILEEIPWKFGCYWPNSHGGYKQEDFVDIPPSFLNIYTPHANKILVHLGIALSVCPSVHIPCKHTSSETIQRISIQLRKNVLFCI